MRITGLLQEIINAVAGTERSDAASEEFRVQRVRARSEKSERNGIRDRDNADQAAGLRIDYQLSDE